MVLADLVIGIYPSKLKVGYKVQDGLTHKRKKYVDNMPLDTEHASICRIVYASICIKNNS